MCLVLKIVKREVNPRDAISLQRCYDNVMRNPFIGTVYIAGRI